MCICIFKFILCIYIKGPTYGACALNSLSILPDNDPAATHKYCFYTTPEKVLFLLCMYVCVNAP